MTRSQYYTEKRALANDASRNVANRHREPWGEDEVEFLTELWDRTEECLREIAEELGRTVEACRQRFYETASGKSVCKSKANLHRSGWLVGFCSTCGHCTDVWCDGSNVMLCEECGS